MTVPDYCTLTEVKTAWPYSGLQNTTGFDTYATALITRASRGIDKDTNREPGAYAASTTTVRYFDGPRKIDNVSLPFPNYQMKSGGYVIGRQLQIDEIAAAPTEVAVAETGDITNYTVWPSSDYYPYPYNALQFNQPYWRLDLNVYTGTHATWYSFPRGVRVTAQFGYCAAVPDDIKEAVILQVIRLLRKAQQNYVEVAAIDMSGQVMQGVKLDQDISNRLATYRRLAI